MRVRWKAGLVSLAALALLAFALAPAASAGQRTVFTGQWVCEDRGARFPLAGMNVELWKRGWDWLPVEISGSQITRGYTAADGTFRMTTPRDDDNYFVRMVLRDAQRVHLKDLVGINDWSVDSGQRHNDRPVRNLGGLLLRKAGKSHKCAIWSGVHHAYADYQTETAGLPLPSHGVEIQADAITAGVPFTPHTSIWWPGDFPVDYDVAGGQAIPRHEFGHVIRHGFDGDLGHFLGDVVDHNYLQNHQACNHTGLGFAFNEGWAEYWARDFGPAPDCGRPGDLETEGNVAAALTDLEANCAANNRTVMVDVLRRNPGRIHSYAEFAAALGCPYPPPTPAPPTLPQAGHKLERKLPDGARARLAKIDVRKLNKRVVVLKRDLRAALRGAANPPPCRKRPCLKTLRKLTRPAGIQMELAIANVQRGAIDDMDSKREQRRLGKAKLAKLIRINRKREGKVRRKTTRVAYAAVRKVLKAARPVFKRDGSKLTRRFRREMTKTAARFKRAMRGGALPPSLTLAPVAEKAPRKVKVVLPQPTPVPVPSPAPTPPAEAQVDATLTIDECPELVAVGKPIEVSGKLLPAVQGSEVKVTYSHANSEPLVLTTKTAADGSWMAEYEPSANFPGTWTIEASFAGDASRKPTSQSCQVDYKIP